MVYGERTRRAAYFVDADGTATPLTRIPFMSGSFNEAWLQRLLEDNPSMIPAYAVSPEYQDLVCIGREVPVGSGEMQGYIDNLYVTPEGGIVIVETKLYRNQEARRTVVAQIIDYAKEVQKWDADKLDRVALDYTGKVSPGHASRIIDLMTSKGYLSYSDEKTLVDNLNAHLSQASFLLLIIGDGIRSGVEQLADFLNTNASMSFKLGLAEIEVYQCENGVVIVPYLLTKTVTIDRNAVDFMPPAEAPRKWKYIAGPVLSRQEFIDRFAENGGYDPDQITDLIYELEAAPGASIKISPTELSVRVSLSECEYFTLLTFGISGGHADVWLVPKRIRESLEQAGRFPFELDSFLEQYRPFCDLRRCKSAPYENEASFYYADLNAILSKEREFIAAVERLSSSM